MLKYLKQKKADLEARKAVKLDNYADIEEKVEEYRKTLLTQRNEEIEQKNMLIDAQVAILDEVIEETERVIEEAEAEAVKATYGEEQKEVEY